MWYSMLLAVASVYLLACSIQTFGQNEHNDMTIYNIVYGLGVAWLVLYGIIKMTKVPEITALWTVSCHAGAILYALLNQLVTSHTSPPAIVIITLTTLITTWAGVKQLQEVCRVHEWTAKAHAHLIFCGVYGILLAMTIYKGEMFHFRMLHTIAATTLTSFFTGWRSNADTVFHGFLMGVTVDGIAYAGSFDAMRYMLSTTPVKDSTLVITWGCVAVLAIFWAHLTARKSVKVENIPLKT